MSKSDYDASLDIGHKSFVMVGDVLVGVAFCFKYMHTTIVSYVEQLKEAKVNVKRIRQQIIKRI